MSRKPIVLIIDDEEFILDSCCQVFTKEGYRTEKAKDGDAGLQKFKETKPDLVLVDLKMPRKSGIEVLEELRTIDPNCVAIVITGYATIESAVEAMKRGAYDFLPKPFTPDELRIIIRRGLERRQCIKEAERLREEKEIMRENFISMVSHELRSPLAAVQQNLMVITGGMVGEIPEKANHMLLRMRARIKDEKKITLRFTAPEKYPSIVGNRETLQMLFTNLIHNGIKYNRRGGKVEVILEDEDQRTKILVKDTGMGIPQEKLPLIFEQFYRVKKKEDVVGSGLGLSIAKKIVVAHSGSIEVESELGKGTTFMVYLP